MIEPLLSPDDHECWALWIRTASVHAHTNAFKRRLDGAKRAIGEALGKYPNAAIMSSFGKDSLVMTHLIAVELGYRLPVFCECDDLDFPDSRVWRERYTNDFDLRTTFLESPISVKQWISDHAHELGLLDDIHSRAAGMAKAAFYDVVESAAAPFDLVFLGLRKDESRSRMMNRVTRGLLYEKKHRLRGAQWVCAPIGDWTGLDVYAYGAAHGLEFKPTYRCISFMHRDEPWRVREAWWIPESNTRRYGGVAWLRRYYPSLYRQLCTWLPASNTLT
jgi:3'-phosphoadenosine 5'-phosphosulfate sulfotransferase (PAPS reductase)/FAD synthetase